jgi:hypothetical protein
LSTMQRRIIFRWTSTPALASISILVVSTLLVEIFFVDYLAATGLEYLSYPVDFLPAIPYVYIPIVGFITVMLFSWTYLTEARSFIRAKPGGAIPYTIMPARMFETAFILLAVLAAALYLPYVFASNWMINNLFSLKQSSSAFAGPLSWFYGGASGAMDLSPIWKYILSNLTAYTIIVVIVLAFASGSRRHIRTR